MYRAEREAKFKALRTYQYPKVAVCTDSLALKNNYNKNNIIQKIQEEIHEITRNLHKDVMLIRVLGHTDIQDNETANHVAKNTELEDDEEEEEIPITSTTLRKTIKKLLNIIELSHLLPVALQSLIGLGLFNQSFP